MKGIPRNESVKNYSTFFFCLVFYLWKFLIWSYLSYHVICDIAEVSKDLKNNKVFFLYLLITKLNDFYPYSPYESPQTALFCLIYNRYLHPSLCIFSSNILNIKWVKLHKLLLLSDDTLQRWNSQYFHPWIVY